MRVEGPDAMRDYEREAQPGVDRRAARRCHEHHRASTRSCSARTPTPSARSCATSLELTSVDAGGGWLIFALPPAELAAHPSATAGHDELYLMCDDLEATVAELTAKGVEFTAAGQRRRAGVC